MTPPMLAIATPSDTAQNPWRQRHDESREEFARFLLWAFGDRSATLSPAASTAAARHDWWRRATALDHRLAPTRSLPEVTRNIALDAITVLSVELEALAASCRATPGNQRLRDLVPLLQLVAQMGGFGAASEAARGAASGDGVDHSALTPDELETLAKASAILAKAKRA